jgi:hypothetical protein
MALSDCWLAAAENTAADGAMGGDCRRQAKEGHRGSKLIKLGSYGGGAARGIHLGAPRAQGGSG